MNIRIKGVLCYRKPKYDDFYILSEPADDHSSCVGSSELPG